jgi:2-oxoglutarate dehydrogenase E2 component (dihydrolipoamide succinyltransferase)
MIAVGEGKTVPIGSVVGHIDPTASGLPVTDQKASPEANAVAPAKHPEKSQPTHVLSPAVRRMVEEEAIKPEEVAGTGPGGRLTKEDVVNFLEQRGRGIAPAPPAPVPAPTQAAPLPESSAALPRETRQAMSAIRQRIADRLVASQKSTATLTTINEADLSAVQALRARFKDAFKERHGVALGFMGFFVKACVEAL